jgi:hypothetical protein
VKPIHPLVLALAFLPLAVFLWDRDRDARQTLQSAAAHVQWADSARKAAEQRAKNAEARYRVDTLRLTQRIITRDTLRQTLTITDTLEVRTFIAAQDSALDQCLVVVQSCEARVAAEIDLRESWRGKYDASEQLRVAERRVPRTAIGFAYDGNFGVAVDRDVERLRVGGSVIPAPMGIRGQLRGQWWW